MRRSKQVLFIALGAFLALLLAFLITLALTFRRLVIEQGRSASFAVQLWREG